MEKFHLFRNATVFSAIFCFSVWVLFFYRLPGDNMFWSSLQNAGHALIFFILALPLCLVIRWFYPHIPPVRVAQIVLISCVTFGGLVEVIQGQVGRNATWSDFYLDVVGIVAGLVAFYAVIEKSIKRIVAIGFATSLIAYCLYDPLVWLYSEKKQDEAFPLIADFENPWLNRYVAARYSSTLSIVDAPPEWEGNSSKVGLVSISPGSWPGLYIEELSSDWRGFGHLVFDVFNPHAEPITLVLRIHDRQHNNTHRDRFNRTYRIPPGLKTIKVNLAVVEQAPRGRAMNMRKVAQIMAYVAHPKENYLLYFDRFRLE